MSEANAWGAKRAAAYDVRTRQLFPAYDDLHAEALRRVGLAVAPGEPVLVLGAGTGEDAIALARAGFMVTASDPSAEMLAVARAKASGLQNLEFEVAFVEQLPPEPRFVAVVAVLVLHFLPDDGAKLAFLQEARIRCLPGGSLVLASLTGQDGDSAFERDFADWLSHIEAVSTPSAFERDRAAILESIRFVSVERTLELMAEAGWTDGAAVWQSGLIELYTALAR